MTSFLPYGRQWIERDDIDAVSAVLGSDLLTTGPVVSRFEEALAAATGAKHAIVCSSGTAALHLACLAAGLGPGDVAAVPAMTFVATANCVRYVGAEVAVADVDRGTGLVTTKSLDAAASMRPGINAVLPVHLNGQTCDVSSIRAWASRRGAVVIEDACHALGTTYEVGGLRYRVGQCAHSDMCVFSFHPVKTVTMGEGGAVTTNDDDLANRLRQFRSHGIERDARHFIHSDMADAPWYYEMQHLGFNYRATDIHCALGLSQLRKLDRFAERRRTLAHIYDEFFSGYDHIDTLPRIDSCDAVLHLYPVFFDWDRLPGGRAQAMNELCAQGIGTQVHYIPVHRQPYYEGLGPCPGADFYYRRALSIPFFPAMMKRDAERVVAALVDIIGST